MALNGNTLAGEIVDAYVNAGKYNGLSPEQILTLKEDLKIMCNAVVAHIIANLEIKGVRITTGADMLDSPTPILPVVMDGGAAVAAQIVGNSKNKNLTQNNDGTGLVL